MKKSIQYIVFVCILSWIVAGVAILLGMRATNGLSYVIFAALYMCIPTLCALLLQAFNKEKLFRNLNISFKFNRWFFIAGIIPIIYAFMALGINLLFPKITFSVTYEGFLSTLPIDYIETAKQQLSRFPPMVFLLIQLIQAIIAGYTINALFAFGEEFGWRGYLLKTFANKKLIIASLMIGTIWGIWHFPLILIGHNYPQHPVAGVAMMVIWCILLSPVMTYIVLKSKSVITAAIFHGTLNAIFGISKLYLVGGNDLINGGTGLSGFIALVFANIAFFLYDKYITKENLFTKVIGEYIK